METGDRLLLHTDGVSERFNPEGEPYGGDRLKQQLESVNHPDPQGIIGEIKRNLERFAQPRPADDDETMTVIVAE
jgi:phosphoserine phosphatase RsbU/P